MSDIDITADDNININIGTASTGNGSETDPNVPAHVKAITEQNIADWNAKADASSVTAEATARASADTTLQNNITAEASNRASADTALQNNITTEASTRANADTTLQNNIVAEGVSRANADNALSALIALCALKADTKIRVVESDVASTTAALIDATGITFDLAANENLVFEIQGMFTASSNIGGRLSISIPAGAFLGAGLFGSVNTNTAFRELFFPTAGGEILNTMWSFAGDSMFYIKGTIFNGATAGTLKLQFRCANAGNILTLKKGSYLIAHKNQILP